MFSFTSSTYLYYRIQFRNDDCYFIVAKKYIYIYVFITIKIILNINTPTYDYFSVINDIMGHVQNPPDQNLPNQIREPPTYRG